MWPTVFVVVVLIALAVVASRRRKASQREFERRWLHKRNRPTKVTTAKTGRHYLVTGGSGFIGSHLVEALLARGETHIRILDIVRSPLFEGEPSVEFVQGSITDIETVTRACRGIDVVFHVAARLDFFTDHWFDAASSNAVNVGGTKNVIAACTSENVPTLVHMSTSTVTFDAGHDYVDSDESAPYNVDPVSHYPRTKKIAEIAVLAANGTPLSNRSGELRTIAVRACGVYGPRDTFMAGSMTSGTAALIGSSLNRSEFVYVENVCHGLVLAESEISRDKGISGKPYYICGDPGGMRFADFTSTLMKHFSVTSCTVLPVPVAHVMAWVFRTIYALTCGRCPTGTLKIMQPPTLKIQMATATYTDRLARKVLRYEPLFTNDEGAAISAAFYRS